MRERIKTVIDEELTVFASTPMAPLDLELNDGNKASLPDHMANEYNAEELC